MTSTSSIPATAGGTRAKSDPADPESIYAALTALALASVEGCDAAGLTVLRKKGGLVVRAASHPTVQKAIDLEGKLGEGPTRHAVEAGTDIGSRDVARDDRWPCWGPRAVHETGLRSVLAIRVGGPGQVRGAMTFYSARHDGFTGDDVQRAEAVAAHASVAVLAAEKVIDLGQALQTRTVIGQAVGILMERYELTSEVAFATLTRVSGAENVKVRDLATSIVEGRPLPSRADQLAPATATPAPQVGAGRRGRRPLMTQYRAPVQPAPFAIELDESAQTLVVSGELDELSIVTLREAIVQGSGSFTQPLSIDLSAVAFLPSAGVGVLATAQQRGTTSGHPVELVAADGTIAQRVLTVCALPFRVA